MQAAAIGTIQPAEARGSIRPIDVRRDLNGIADLVELCFSDTLDPDGQSYLKQMRTAARASHWLDWLANFSEQPNDMPTSGFVWEVEGRVVGNLSLISFHHKRQHLSLIANVAVHPDFRRRGIARQLTATALDFIRRQSVPAAWLHVRRDNPSAIHLYETLGFQERARRTTWNSLPEPPPPFTVFGLEISPRRAPDWAQQRQWLSELYPDAFSWHLPLDWHALADGWVNTLYRFTTLTFPRHWMARQEGALLGGISWLPRDGFADALFLAAPAGCAPDPIQALLTQVRRSAPRRKAMTLNCPADLAPEAIRSAGFYNQQTLLWMEHKFT